VTTPGESTPPVERRWLEIVAIGVTPVALGLLVLRLARLLTGPAAWATALVALPGGYVAADLMSGIVHWLADRFGTPATPVLGKLIIQPFRDHHADPLGITRHDFIDVNGGNCIVLMPAIMGVVVMAPAAGQGWPAVLLTAGMLSFSLAIIGTNQFHRWAHSENRPAWVRWLQRHRLILSAEHHALHHTSPFATHYCITTGWMNAPLERLDVFVRAERLLGRLPDPPPPGTGNAPR
jgi:ubiquitin-conjugating enzyme E2 variant